MNIQFFPTCTQHNKAIFFRGEAQSLAEVAILAFILSCMGFSRCCRNVASCRALPATWHTKSERKHSANIPRCPKRHGHLSAQLTNCGNQITQQRRARKIQASGSPMQLFVYQCLRSTSCPHSVFRHQSGTFIMASCCHRQQKTAHRPFNSKYYIQVAKLTNPRWASGWMVTDKSSYSPLH